MSLDIGIGQNGWYKQIAAEFVKYECLSYPGPPNKKIMDKMNNAYTEMAKTLGLADIQAVKTEISNMKKYIYKMMRRCVRLSIMNGGESQDALNYAPSWFKLLDPHMKLFKLACKMETLQTLKNYNTGNRVFQVTSEIVRCACRAAARELARDCTNEGASKPSKDSTKGGSRGLAGNRTNGEASKLAKDGTNGGVSAIGSHNTSGGVSDSAIDSTERAARAATALVSKDAVREYAESVDIHVNILHSIWTRIYAQSICKLMSLIAAGDKASEKYAPIDWIVADAALLYDTRLTVVIDKTFQSSVTLQPLILLYKLMVAAHEKMKNLMAKNIIGAQTGTLENSNINIPSSSSESIPDKDTSEMRVDGNKSNDLETESPKDTYELDRSRHIWAMVHLNYILSGRSSSAVLLQRRWHEMKQMARQLLTGKDAPLSPSPILLALAKRFPSILTEKLPPWSELVLDNLICQDSQLEPYRRLYAGIRLEVPNEIGENLIFDDLYDWSDDEVEVIDEKRETIIVPDSDDEETDKVTNEQTDTSVNNTTIDNNTSELNDEYDSIKKLESIDPTKAKVRIIFENDSDDELNDFIHGVNDPGASKNTNSNITNVIEGLIRNSVSNEIETQVRPDNHNQNVGIDMDEVICDLRNNLIRVSSNVSNKDTQTIYTDSEGDSDAADEMCDDIDEPSRDDEGERPDPLLVDKKLVQLSYVVLTPIEDLPEWRKHSRNNMIKCRQFSVRNFTKKVHVTSKQLENCRPYISKKSSNGIWFRKNQELRQIPKDIRKKINILSKRLNLSRTYFSQEFWSERNLELMELCRPFSIQLKRIPRVIKRIELADIDDVRRINSTILTAQVAPITVEANRMFVLDPSAPSTTAERVQQSSGHSGTDVESRLNKYKTNLPSNLTVVQENEKISNSVAEENFPTPNLPEDNTPKSLDSNLEKEELPTESDVKEMIKTIVRKGHLPKATDTAYVYETQDYDYHSKQKDLEKDLRQISKVVLMNFKLPENKTPNKRKNIKSVKTQPDPTPNESTLNSLEEWKRQKEQNLVYFNLNTNLEVNKKLGKHVNQYTNKKKKENKDKSKAEVNLHKDNEKQSKDTSGISVSSNCSENVIEKTSSELNQYTHKIKKDEEDKSNAEVNLHKDNDKQSKDTSEISDSSNCSENVIEKTSSELNQYMDKIKKDEKDKSNAEVNLHKDNDKQSKDTSEISDSSNCSENVIEKTSSELNQYMDKIKKDEKDKSNAEVNLHKDNDKQSKDTSEISDSSNCSENVIEKTSCELNQYTNKIKKDEEDKSNAEVNLHKDNDIQSKDTSEISDSSNCSENVIEKTSSELDQYTNKIKKDEEDKSNAEVNLHKENEGSQSKDTCKISDSNDCSEKVIKRPYCGFVIEVPTKSPRLEIDDKAINAPSDVIEVSDDSSDRDIEIMSTVQSNNINTESSNNQNQSQVTVNIIKNTIKIVGSGSNKQQKNKEKNAISFLSKVAANIQKNVAPASSQNNNVFYVVKDSESNLTQAILDTNARDVVVKTNSVSNSTYYVVNVPDHDTGSNKTIISPLQESTTQMPVIQSVTSLSQLSHQSLNQMPPDVIDLNQAFPNQIQPVINLNQAFQNQIQPVINLNQVIHNQINPVINLNQSFHNQINPIIDLNQASLNQNPPTIYIYQPSPNQAPPLIDINQPSVNQILPQNEMSHIYPNQVLTVSQTNSANHTIVGNAFENLVKRPSNNQFQNTNSQPVGVAPMPLIQSVSSLRQIDQQNIPKNTKSQIMPIRSVTSRPVTR